MVRSDAGRRATEIAEQVVEELLLVGLEAVGHPPTFGPGKLQEPADDGPADGVAVGPSCTFTTVITSFAGAETFPSLSVTVNGTVTVPLKFAAGLNTRLAACAAVIAVPATTAVTPSAR